jgi:Tfp pilus assembly protein PilX
MVRAAYLEASQTHLPSISVDQKKAQSIAESSFRDLEKRVEEAVAMEVAEGTRALASELDEAYDRSDELGKEVR